jgi:ketosteroid isomerase-like protein
VILRFRWTGVLDGERRAGAGRGTNVLTKRAGTWLISHEHLSH